MNSAVKSHVLFALCACLMWPWILGCDGGGDGGEESSGAEAEPIALAECTACGMVVREQPAPRGQVVHRDGTREFFCAMSDLLYYIETPSPHGRITDVFVEVLPEETDPLESDSREQPWVRAEDARYIVGVERTGIMGPPVLAYLPEVDVEALAADFGGEVVEWEELAARVIADAQ